MNYKTTVSSASLYYVCSPSVLHARVGKEYFTLPYYANPCSRLPKLTLPQVPKSPGLLLLPHCDLGSLCSVSTTCPDTLQQLQNHMVSKNSNLSKLLGKARKPRERKVHRSATYRVKPSELSISAGLGPNTVGSQGLGLNDVTLLWTSAFLLDHELSSADWSYVDLRGY